MEDDFDPVILEFMEAVEDLTEDEFNELVERIENERNKNGKD